jgi:hypothetical protein
MKLPPLLGGTINLVAMFEVGKAYQVPNGPRPLNTRVLQPLIACRSASTAGSPEHWLGK